MPNILNLSWSTNLSASDSQRFIEAGQIARVRSRQYLIEEVVPKPASNQEILAGLRHFPAPLGLESFLGKGKRSNA